jgi:hypothetical protein
VFDERRDIVGRFVGVFRVKILLSDVATGNSSIELRESRLKVAHAVSMDGGYMEGNDDRTFRH